MQQESKREENEKTSHTLVLSGAFSHLQDTFFFLRMR